ncbi:MAG: lytic transglycosylase domain-containing protein [Flavipsychrobacter sp.]
MKRKPVIYFLLGAVIAASVFSVVAFKVNDNDENVVEVKKNKKLQYKWYIPDIPEQIEFAGEPVPLHRWDVREQLEREVLTNSYYHTSTLYILRLQSRYFPTIERRLKANGVPDDFKYLCVAESALRNQISGAGAVGFWQFMKGTAPRYGLEVTSEVDERYDVEKSTDAACKYLKEAYEKFGSWTAAAASYNCGQAGFNKFSSYQQKDNYYDLLLPEETMRYVFRILALKHIMSNAKELGFVVYDDDAYQPLAIREIEVKETITNLADFALYNNSNYRMLKLLNPWLRGHALTVKNGKTYTVKLPAKK